MINLRLCACLAAALFFPAVPQARIFFVAPGQDIQMVIDATRTLGDTLILEDGRHYARNLRFHPHFGYKGLVFGSRYILDGDPGHADRCIIDGGNTTEQYGSVLFINEGLDATARFVGFTITGGTGSDEPGVMTGGQHGGAIYAIIPAKPNTSTLHMELVKVIGNTADYYPGILCNLRYVTLINCTISDNRVPSYMFVGGSNSALYLSASGSMCISVDLRGCVITDNYYIGLYINGCQATPPTLRNCIIAGNGFGAFVKWRESNTIMTNCLFTGNRDYGLVLDDQNGDMPMTLTVKNSMLLDPIRTYSGVMGNLIATDSWFGTIHSTFTTVDTTRCRMNAVPMFVDSARRDYRLLATSQAVDGGDPADDFPLEPFCGGANTAIDIGAYGNTPKATCKAVGAHMLISEPLAEISLFRDEILYDTVRVTNREPYPMFVRTCDDLSISDSNLVCTGMNPQNAPLGQDEFVEIYLRYSSSQPLTGVSRANLNFPADNAGAQLQYAATVENKGVDALFANNWDVGPAPLHTPALKVFHLKNLGHNPITVTSFGASSPVFTLEGPSSFTLAPGDSLPFTVTFLPDSARVYQARITLHSPNLKAADSTLVLRGTGVDTGLVGAAAAPRKLEALRNAPNPFSTTSHLTVGLPEASRLDLSVHDIAGMRVKSIHAGLLPTGYHGFTWDGRDDGGTPLPSGVYYYRISTRTGALVCKVILAR